MLPGGSSRTFCCRISQKASQTPVTWCNVVHVSPKVTNLEINWDNNKEQLSYCYDVQGTSKSWQILLTNEVVLLYDSVNRHVNSLSPTCDTLKRHVQSQMPTNSQSREWMWQMISDKWSVNDQNDFWLTFGWFLVCHIAWHFMTPCDIWCHVAPGSITETLA